MADRNSGATFFGTVIISKGFIAAAETSDFDSSSCPAGMAKHNFSVHKQTFYGVMSTLANLLVLE